MATKPQRAIALIFSGDYVPAKSPSALDRKREQKNAKRRAARRAQVIASRPQLVGSPTLPEARRMLPKVGPKSKADLREMLKEAVLNTPGGRM
jgi:hypothetical protein